MARATRSRTGDSVGAIGMGAVSHKGVCRYRVGLTFGVQGSSGWAAPICCHPLGLERCNHSICRLCSRHGDSAAVATPDEARRAWDCGTALGLQTQWSCPAFQQGGWHQGQGGVQQPGVCVGPSLRHMAQPQDHPDSDHQQDIQDKEEWFIFWNKSPPKTSVVCDAAGGHVDVHDPCCHSCYGQGSLFCSGIDDCRLIAENERHDSIEESP